MGDASLVDVADATQKVVSGAKDGRDFEVH